MELLVSIIVPCFNQGVFLSETLESVVKQSYDHWECVVVNDGSTDNTAIVANEWCKKDKRISLLSQANGGLSNARNNAIRASKGFFILPLDADDIIAPEYLDIAIKSFSIDPNITLVYGKAHLFGIKSGVWDLPKYSFKTLLLNNCIYCSAIFRKSIWEQYGGYDENLKSGSEDWEFWIKILDGESIVHFIEEVVFYYRQRVFSMQKELASNVSKTEQINIYIYKKHIEKYTSEFGSPLSIIGQLELLTEDKKQWTKSFRYNFARSVIQYWKRIFSDNF